MNYNTIHEIYKGKPGAILRSRVYIKFNNLLLSYAMENSVAHTLDMIDKMSRNLEIEIFNSTIRNTRIPSFKNPEFVKEYKKKFVLVFTNIDPNGCIGNKNLIFRFLLLKELNPKEIVNDSGKILFSRKIK